ncbi:MAG: hypothetical protein MHM6MM_002265 [Cercozoa sp. M6MM]
MPNPKALTKEEAYHVKTQCLRDQQQRLLVRAKIIQERLTEETTLLERERDKLSYILQNKPADERRLAEAEFQDKQEKALFRIAILESRLARHEKNALARYSELNERLANDPRLQVLYEEDAE